MLRLPVIGDMPIRSGVKRIAKACQAWLERGGAGVWGYTHGWRRVPREDWGPASVLASIENVNDLHVAAKQGYACARVVEDFPNGSRAWLETIRGVTYRFIPCPEQTSGVTCSECRLCFRDEALKSRNAVIAFKVHSQVSKRALNVLKE
jgi:hypothetical protein